MAADIKGESGLIGKGVSYCATCDGPLYRGKDVAVIGYTEQAEEEVEYFCEVAQSVHYLPQYRIDTDRRERLMAVSGGRLTILSGKPAAIEERITPQDWSTARAERKNSWSGRTGCSSSGRQCHWSLLCRGSRCQTVRSRSQEICRRVFQARLLRGTAQECPGRLPRLWARVRWQHCLPCDTSRVSRIPAAVERFVSVRRVLREDRLR